MIIRTEAQWRALFQQHKNSGLSSNAFCKRHKLCPKYFSLRKKQLGLSDTSSFVELQIKAPKIQERSPALALTVGACSLQFGALPSAEWLSTFLKASA